MNNQAEVTVTKSRDLRFVIRYGRTDTLQASHAIPSANPSLADRGEHRPGSISQSNILAICPPTLRGLTKQTYTETGHPGTIETTTSGAGLPEGCIPLRGFLQTATLPQSFAFSRETAVLHEVKYRFYMKVTGPVTGLPRSGNSVRPGNIFGY